jgi:isoamylase
MTDDEWVAGWVRTLGVRFGGDALHEVDENGDLLEDDTLLLLMNAHTEPVDFQLPGGDGVSWEVLVDTCAPDGRSTARHEAGSRVPICDRALLLLRRPSG